MDSWRQTILDDLQPDISPVTLVHDPDGLFGEQTLLSEVGNRGFDVVRFEDPIAFRFRYETWFRPSQDSPPVDPSEKQRELVVLVDDETAEAVPYDVVRISRRLEYSLKALFPKLNHPVLAELDRGLLESLKRAERFIQDETTFGESATRNHVLRFCFRVLPEQLDSSVELMRMLFSNSFGKNMLPLGLIKYLLGLLKQNSVFSDWPLEQILSDRQKFKQFVEDQWQLYIHGLLGQPDAGVLIPFDDPDVQAYMDTYFWEGVLKPVEVEDPSLLPVHTHVGLQFEKFGADVKQFDSLIAELKSALADTCESYRDWQRVARLWGELVYLRWKNDAEYSGEQIPEFNRLNEQIQTGFKTWMLEKFGSLHNQPYLSSPVMVHHIAPFIAHRESSEKIDKVALVIFDGLAIDQWVILRNHFQIRMSSWSFDESQVYSWVPTLTTIARQSIFAADMPMFFEKSIDSTYKEPNHWQRFWVDQGKTKDQIAYVKILSDDYSELQECCDNPFITCLGVVVNKPDQFVHKQVQGTRGLHADVEVWKDSALQIVKRLVNAGYSVFISSDHGNVEARGIGKPNEGVLVDTDGKRARIYDNDDVREQAKQEFPDSFKWPNIGLPPDKHVLLPEYNSAFWFENRLVVSHGGISIEEVIVPFVRLQISK